MLQAQNRIADKAHLSLNDVELGAPPTEIAFKPIANPPQAGCFLAEQERTGLPDVAHQRGLANARRTDNERIAVIRIKLAELFQLFFAAIK